MNDQHSQRCTDNLMGFCTLLKRLILAVFSFSGASLITLGMFGFSMLSISIIALLLSMTLQLLAYSATGLKHG